MRDYYQNDGLFFVCEEDLVKVLNDQLIYTKK